MTQLLADKGSRDRMRPCEPPGNRNRPTRRHAHRTGDRRVAVAVAPVAAEPAIACVTKRSPGAGDPHDRGVAIAMARRKAAGRQERSRDAGSRTLKIGRRRSPWSAAPALAFTRFAEL